MHAKEVFKDIFPILEKAAPLICQALIKDPKIAMVVCGMLGAIVNANPYSPEDVAHKLKKDPDLFQKLTQLESSHGEWLSGIPY